MKTQSELLQLAPDKGETAISKEEQFDRIFAQLQQRNNSNKLFISQFMHQIQKKYHRKAALTVRMQDNYHTAASQPENNTCDSLPSCYRHHTEEILPSSEDCHDPCEKQFLNSGISSACDLEMLEKKRQWCQSKKSSQNKGERTMRDEIKQEIGFKRYLKRAYLQENSQCSTFSYIEGPKENKSTQSKNSKQMCLNIRNMAFGHQDLNSFGKQSSPDASFRQKLDAGKIKRKELSRGNELFLPKIRRGSGGKLERGKIEGRSGEKMMMIQEEGPEGCEEGYSRSRALWVCENMNRIGLSFRINTIPIKKNY